MRSLVASFMIQFLEVGDQSKPRTLRNFAAALRDEIRSPHRAALELL